MIAIEPNLRTEICNIEHHEQILQQNEQSLQQHEQSLQQHQEDITDLQDNAVQVQINIQNLSQMQVKDHAQLQEITKRLESFETLHQKSQARRSNLAKVTRKKNLSPIARKLYDNNIKLLAQKRRMKRYINRMKQQNKVKKITLSRKEYKDQENKTTKVRENFVNMIIRNNDVAPQVM